MRWIFAIDGASARIEMRTFQRELDYGRLRKYFEAQFGERMAAGCIFDGDDKGRDKRVAAYYGDAAAAGFKIVVHENGLKNDKHGQIGVDVALAIECIELYYGEYQWDCVVIWAGDGDYFPLAHRLRAYGKRVILVGDARSRRAFYKIGVKY